MRQFANTTTTAKHVARKAPANRTGASASDAQMRQLKFGMIRRAVLYWIIYTAIFAGCAWGINAALIPSIGNDIADSSSSWMLYSVPEKSLSEMLDDVDATLVGIVGAKISANDEGDSSSKKAMGLTSQNVGDIEDSYMTNDASNSSSTSVQDEWINEWLDITGDAYDIITTPEGGVYTLDIEGGLPVSYIEKLGTDLGDSSLLIRGEDDTFEWITFAELRQKGYRALFPEVFDDADNRQIIYGEDGFSVRDLTFYNQLKALKWPLAIGIYMFGCIILIYLVFRRYIAYFKDLSAAVGDLISDKQRPIELPIELAITQNELNSIRLSSLSDERAAVAAERRKDELVAYLAHDIKTPLTSVIGYLMLLDESPDLPTDSRTRYVHIASEKAQRLETMVDEFFEITRYNLQSIPLERTKVDIRLFLEQVADEFAPAATDAGLKIAVFAQSRQIYADGDKLARAVGNVLRNAIAYADRGTVINIRAEIQEERMSISIEDKGREISEAHLASIFEKFYRVDSARSSTSGNAGLGLAIAREIVKAHGGDISAKSSAGVTVFTISIPID